MTPLDIYEATQQHFLWCNDLVGMNGFAACPYFTSGDGLWLTYFVPPVAREYFGVCAHIGDSSFKFPYES